MEPESLKMLWIAPILNHYKASFLNRLTVDQGIDLWVLAGTAMREQGHGRYQGEETYQRIDVQADKSNFSFRWSVYVALFRLISRQRFKFVMMPTELKFMPLIIYTFLLKWIYRFQMISYSHPIIGTQIVEPGKKRLAKFLFWFYDRVIFYTWKSRDRALAHGLLPERKAFAANNTLNTVDIWQHYQFEINHARPMTLLFIGRLVSNKRLETLFAYFQRLRQELGELRLIIVGDGPLSDLVKEAVDKDHDIQWLGQITEEARIAEIMRQVHVVFLPGHTGLSIVHAFCYGKPFVAMSNYLHHPPEIDYLEDGFNGLYLSGDMESDIPRFVNILSDTGRYEEFCRNAFSSARELSVQKWCEDIHAALSSKVGK